MDTFIVLLKYPFTDYNIKYYSNTISPCIWSLLDLSE